MPRAHRFERVSVGGYKGIGLGWKVLLQTREDQEFSVFSRALKPFLAPSGFSLRITSFGRWGWAGGWPGQPAPSLPGARATPAQPASGGGCLPQPRWADCTTGAAAHQGQTSREGEKDIWWAAGTACGGTGHLGLTHTETQRGRLWTACGQRRVDGKNSQTTPATTSTFSIRQLLGAADAQTAHHATFSTAPTQQLLGSANAKTTLARAPAAAAGRKQQPDATCEGKNG